MIEPTSMCAPPVPAEEPIEGSSPANRDSAQAGSSGRSLVRPVSSRGGSLVRPGDHLTSPYEGLTTSSASYDTSRSLEDAPQQTSSLLSRSSDVGFGLSRLFPPSERRSQSEEDNTEPLVDIPQDPPSNENEWRPIRDGYHRLQVVTIPSLRETIARLTRQLEEVSTKHQAANEELRKQSNEYAHTIQTMGEDREHMESSYETRIRELRALSEFTALKVSPMELQFVNAMNDILMGSMEELAQRWTLFFRKIHGLPLTTNEEALERAVQVAMMNKPPATHHHTPRPHFEDDDTTDDGDDLPVLRVASSPRISTDFVPQSSPPAALPLSPSQSSLQQTVAEVKPPTFSTAVPSNSDSAIPPRGSNTSSLTPSAHATKPVAPLTPGLAPPVNRATTSAAGSSGAVSTDPSPFRRKRRAFPPPAQPAVPPRNMQTRSTPQDWMRATQTIPAQDKRERQQELAISDARRAAIEAGEEIPAPKIVYNEVFKAVQITDTNRKREGTTETTFSAVDLARPPLSGVTQQEPSPSVASDSSGNDLVRDKRQVTTEDPISAVDLAIPSLRGVPRLEPSPSLESGSSGNDWADEVNDDERRLAEKFINSGNPALVTIGKQKLGLLPRPPPRKLEASPKLELTPLSPTLPALPAPATRPEPATTLPSPLQRVSPETRRPEQQGVHTSKGTGKNVQRKGRTTRPKTTCWECGKEGHFAKNCKIRQEIENGPGNGSGAAVSGPSQQVSTSGGTTTVRASERNTAPLPSSGGTTAVQASEGNTEPSLSSSNKATPGTMTHPEDRAKFFEVMANRIPFQSPILEKPRFNPDKDFPASLGSGQTVPVHDGSEYKLMAEKNLNPAAHGKTLASLPWLEGGDGIASGRLFFSPERSARPGKAPSTSASSADPVVADQQPQQPQQSQKVPEPSDWKKVSSSTGGGAKKKLVDKMKKPVKFSANMFLNLEGLDDQDGDRGSATSKKEGTGQKARGDQPLLHGTGRKDQSTKSSDNLLSTSSSTKQITVPPAQQVAAAGADASENSVQASTETAESADAIAANESKAGTGPDNLADPPEPQASASSLTEPPQPRRKRLRFQPREVSPQQDDDS